MTDDRKFPMHEGTKKVKEDLDVIPEPKMPMKPVMLGKPKKTAKAPKPKTGAIVYTRGPGGSLIEHKS